MKHQNAKKTLFLGDFASQDADSIRAWMAKEFQIPASEVEPFQIISGCLDEGSWEGSVWFLLRCRETGNYFEVFGGHCSCYGFEDQFSPEPTTIAYLTSDKFGVSGFSSLVPTISAFIKTL